MIIPARDAEATLPALLDALAAQVGDFEVILVDDGSVDGTARVAESAPFPVRVVQGRGEGPAAARNLGAAAARGAVLAFTDADCVPAPGWLAAVLAAAADADLVQGRVMWPPDTPMGPFDRWIAVVSEYGLYETANLAVRRELFERLGGFESILTPRSGIELGEDVWLGWRARRAGARTTFAHDALVYHAVFPRGPAAYVAERWRLRFFPELARRIPELRDEFFHFRVFLNARTARFDLALAGAAAAIAGRRAFPLALAVPYAREALREARRWEGHAVARVAAAQVAADAVGAAALVVGSLRSRSLLL